jgi:hypothetical protein
MLNIALHGSISLGGNSNDFLKNPSKHPHMKGSLFWQGFLVDTLVSNITTGGSSRERTTEGYVESATSIQYYLTDKIPRSSVIEVSFNDFVEKETKPIEPTEPAKITEDSTESENPLQTALENNKIVK